MNKDESQNEHDEHDDEFDGQEQDVGQDQMRPRRRRRAAWSSVKVGAQIVLGQFAGWCLHRWLG